MHYSTKTYDHNEGLSCVFRQPNAVHSHCKLLHGYALSFRFKFACSELDNKNWVVDFGGLKELKTWLHDSFDHKLVIDSKDEAKDFFYSLENHNLAEVVEFDGVGCEKFAEHAFNKANEIVRRITENRCWCVECEVREHGGNSGVYESK